MNQSLADRLIEDTFAEAFPMKVVRLIVTAHDQTWAMHGAASFCGFATSVIGCGCEAGIECTLTTDQTPDGRPGVALLIFAMSTKDLGQQLINRVGQCLLTCPSVAVFSGLASAERLPLGDQLRYFGDGYQICKNLGERRLWRIPVMGGEFLCEDQVGMSKSAVGGGNMIVLFRNQSAALSACSAAIAAMREVAGVIMPFPGGVVGSGSKVGSRYPALKASTNHPYCPTLRGLQDSQLDNEVGCVLEIVIDGLTPELVSQATGVGLKALLDEPADIVRISAGNYGGKLGPYHFWLKKIFAEIS